VLLKILFKVGEYQSKKIFRLGAALKNPEEGANLPPSPSTNRVKVF